MSEITFQAVVYKVATLVDKGIRVTIDLPETCTMQMAQLAECKRFGVYLNISFDPKTLTDLDDETENDTEIANAKMGRRRTTNRRDQR
jgi:hypothetical protein